MLRGYEHVGRTSGVQSDRLQPPPATLCQPRSTDNGQMNMDAGALSPTAPVIVIGAGITGIAAARELGAAGFDTLVLDRGRRIGGRMASTILRDTGTVFDGHVVDYGAAYFTAYDPAFGAIVDDWCARGLARQWTDTLRLAGPAGFEGLSRGPMRYAARGGLRSLVEDLARTLPANVSIVSEHEVTTLSVSENGPLVDGRPARAVALAMPDPQARRLLSRDPALSHLRAITETAVWEPVLTLTAVFHTRTWPDFDAAFINDDEILGLVADDGSRRGDGAAVLVAHSTSAFAATFLQSPGSAVSEMVRALTRVLGVAEPAWTSIHRWSHARPLIGWPETYAIDSGTMIGLAGDGWGSQSRIGTAWRSGHDLGRNMAAALRG